MFGEVPNNRVVSCLNKLVKKNLKKANMFEITDLSLNKFALTLIQNLTFEENLNMTLQLIAATAWFWTFSIGFMVSIFISTILLFIPLVRWAVISYMIWIVYDRNASIRGGRPIKWVQQWTWWRLMKQYFNHNLRTASSFQLNAAKNYIFVHYPHGIFPVGPFASFVNGYQKLFPNHRVFTTALGIQFWVPVIRELWLSIGAVNVSGPSVKYLLKKPKGGNIVSILVGGGEESKYSRPGKYKIILEKRKGFVKVALQHGTPLVPVITFGDTDVFDQLNFPGFAIIQSLVKSLTQVVLVLPIGKCFVFPYKVPIVTVVGTPIEVDKIENPTNAEIEATHRQFMEGLKKLFENHKHKYVKSPENTFLEIV